MNGPPEAPDVVVGVRDHLGQGCASKAPIAVTREFNIGCFREDGSLAPDDDKLRDPLVKFCGSLLPRVEAFGEGMGAFRRVIELGLFDQLVEAVRDHVGPRSPNAL